MVNLEEEPLQDIYYYYILLERPIDEGNLEDNIIKAFQAFQANHSGDLIIETYSPNDFERFDRARRTFNLKRLPGFAISDEPQDFQGNVSPCIALDRSILEFHPTVYQLHTFITDFHYQVQDKEILRKSRHIAEDVISSFLGRMWDDLGDSVIVNV